MSFFATLQHKPANQPLQIFGPTTQRVTSRRCLFDHRRIVLCQLINPIDLRTSTTCYHGDLNRLQLKRLPKDQIARLVQTVYSISEPHDAGITLTIFRLGQ